MALRSNDSFKFGVGFVLLAIVVGIAGYIRGNAVFAPTTGRITHVELASNYYGPGPRVLGYTYTVAGSEYSGQGTVRYSLRQDDSLQVGREIPLFYDSSHPAVSYPFSPRVASVGSALRSSLLRLVSLQSFGDGTAST
jgi:hypothetical protein